LRFFIFRELFILKPYQANIKSSFLQFWKKYSKCFRAMNREGILDPNAKQVKGNGYDEFGGTEEVVSKSVLNNVKFTGVVQDTASSCIT
jgi:hypothetical protein